MSAMTNYLEKKLLDHTLKIASYTMPTAVYLALFTADPTDTGSLTNEVAAGGYARQDIDTDMAATNATTGVSSNSTEIEFGPAGASWGTLTHFGIMDASTAGNMLIHGALASSRLIETGDSAQIGIGTLVVTFA